MAQSSTSAPPPAASARDHVHKVVSRSGSSFTWGMRILPRPRREAMYAIYAFCREVDDVADDQASQDWKLGQLAEWRLEIDRLYNGRPTRPTTLALLPQVQAYRLPKDEFLAVIDGMDMDARGPIAAPSWADFQLYCRRVAGAVGLLSIRAFGATEPEAAEIAVTLGEALQITNILRDLDEDAAEGRLYLPRELLEKAEIDATSPQAVLAHPALPRACIPLARRARDRFAATRSLLRRCNRRRLRPCILMMEVYERILTRLERRGWAAPRSPVRISKGEKLWIVLRHGLL